jgi:hypothetical protein
MRKQRHDFQNKHDSRDYYDLREDWGLVEASIAKQYGIRIRQHTDMSWPEFCTLVSGLMPDTPLGQIVSIRAEIDSKVIKNFNSDQKKIYNDWRLRQANKQLEDTNKLDKDIANLEKMFASMFGNKGVKE